MKTGLCSNALTCGFKRADADHASACSAADPGIWSWWFSHGDRRFAGGIALDTSGSHFQSRLARRTAMFCELRMDARRTVSRPFRRLETCADVSANHHMLRATRHIEKGPCKHDLVRWLRRLRIFSREASRLSENVSPLRIFFIFRRKKFRALRLD